MFWICPSPQLALLPSQRSPLSITRLKALLAPFPLQKHVCSTSKLPRRPCLWSGESRPILTAIGFFHMWMQRMLQRSMLLSTTLPRLLTKSSEFVPYALKTISNHIIVHGEPMTLTRVDVVFRLTHQTHQLQNSHGKVMELPLIPPLEVTMLSLKQTTRVTLLISTIIAQLQLGQTSSTISFHRQQTTRPTQMHLLPNSSTPQTPTTIFSTNSGLPRRPVTLRPTSMDKVESVLMR